LAIGGAVANTPSFVLSFIHPAFFALGMGSTTAAIGGTYATLASKIAADKIIKNNRKETAAKMVEKLTGNKVDRKTMATNVDELLKSIPEYNRVYNMTAGGKALSEDKIIPQLKTTDSDNAVNNTTNRNRAPIPVALPTGRNTNVGVSSQIRNTRSKKAVDKERENFVKKELARARRTGEYDMEFLERNLDIDPRTDKQYTPKAMEKAYAKYLNAEYLKRKSNSETKPAASPATKNTNVGVSSSKKGSMKSLYAKGVSIDEIAEKLGVSPSTVSKYVK
jgi:predicted transcriptional regulator